jgi:deoxyadenosine/deoxycytidine kinase
VIQRRIPQLFAKVRKRGRVIEQDQEDSLNFHYHHYEDVLRRIFKNYKVSEAKILWLPIEDMNDPAEFAEIIRKIESRFVKR